MNKQEREASRKICEAYCETVVDLLVKKCVVRAGGKEILPEMPTALGCFIAHARTALPDALDEIERLEAERDRYKAALEEIVQVAEYEHPATKYPNEMLEADVADFVMGIARCALKGGSDGTSV